MINCTAICRINYVGTGYRLNIMLFHGSVLDQEEESEVRPEEVEVRPPLPAKSQAAPKADKLKKGPAPPPPPVATSGNRPPPAGGNSSQPAAAEVAFNRADSVVDSGRREQPVEAEMVTPVRNLTKELGGQDVSSSELDDETSSSLSSESESDDDPETEAASPIRKPIGQPRELLVVDLDDDDDFSPAKDIALRLLDSAIKEAEDSICSPLTDDEDDEDNEAEITLSPSSPTLLTPTAVKLPSGRPTSISPGASRPTSPRSQPSPLPPTVFHGGDDKSLSPSPSPSMDRPSPDGSSNSGSPVPAKSPCPPARHLHVGDTPAPLGSSCISVPGTPTLPTAPPSSLETAHPPPLPPKTEPAHVSVIVLGQDSCQVCCYRLRCNGSM